MMKKRSLSVDIAKGVAILAIVLGHINLSMKSSLVSADDLIYLWHVPVFFILGGFFIKEEQVEQPCFWFKKKFFSLYLKILYFYVPAVLLHNAFIKIGWYSLQSTNPVIHSYTTIEYVKEVALSIFLAGREPIVGPMWFVYVLFMALIGLSIVSWFASLIVKDFKKRTWIISIALVTMTIISGILSNKYGLTIRRFSNVFTAMLLIYIGWLMNRKCRLAFDNAFLAIICALVSFEMACMLGGVSLNGNSYKDITQLIVAAPAVLYCIMYLAKKIENTYIGRALAKCGYESFYIMALHLTAFKVCTILLQTIGLRGGYELSQLTPSVGSNMLLLSVYLLFGVGFPILFMFCFRKARTIIANIFR